MKTTLTLLLLIILVGCTTSSIPDMSFKERFSQLQIPKNYEVSSFGESHHSGGDWYYKRTYSVNNNEIVKCEGNGEYCCIKDVLYDTRTEDCQYAITINDITEVLNPVNIDTTSTISQTFSDRICYYPVKILQRFNTISNDNALVCFNENNHIVTFANPVHSSPSSNFWSLKEFPISSKIYEFIGISQPSKNFDKLKV